MNPEVYQCWPSVFDGKQSYLLATPHSLHFHPGTPAGFRPEQSRLSTDEEIQGQFPRGLKSLDRRDLQAISWNPEQLRLSLEGLERKIVINFRQGLEELGDSYYRELVNHLPELGEIEEEEQVFLDRHAGAILNLMGFGLAALILWWMQSTDDPLDYEGRRRGYFEMAKGYLALTGIWGVVGVAAVGVFVSAKRYFHRAHHPVPMFVARRIN